MLLHLKTINIGDYPFSLEQKRNLILEEFGVWNLFLNLLLIQKIYIDFVFARQLLCILEEYLRKLLFLVRLH